MHVFLSLIAISSFQACFADMQQKCTSLINEHSDAFDITTLKVTRDRCLVKRTTDMSVGCIQTRKPNSKYLQYTNYYLDTTCTELHPWAHHPQPNTNAEVAFLASLYPVWVRLFNTGWKQTILGITIHMAASTKHLDVTLNMLRRFSYYFDLLYRCNTKFLAP